MKYLISILLFANKTTFQCMKHTHTQIHWSILANNNRGKGKKYMSLDIFFIKPELYQKLEFKKIT